jgi:hypothetical protein
MISLQSKDRVYVGPDITRDVLKLGPNRAFAYQYTRGGSIKIGASHNYKLSEKRGQTYFASVDKDGAIRLTLPYRYNYASVTMRKSKSLDSTINHIYIIPQVG